MARTPATRRSLRKAEDRDRIYQTALGLIQSQGFEATTIRDITAASQVALGTFFKHFPSKEHLLVGYYLQLQTELAESLARPRRSFSAYLKAFTTFLAGQVQTHPQLYRAIGQHMLSSGALQEAEHATCGDLHRRLQEALARGVQAGELRPEVDPEATASLLLLAFNGAILDSLPDLAPATFQARLHHYLHQIARLIQA